MAIPLKPKSPNAKVGGSGWWSRLIGNRFVEQAAELIPIVRDMGGSSRRPADDSRVEWTQIP